MNDLEKKLIELTKFWYEYVAQDHHKDRDCHFYINKVWSYGQEPYYRIENYGYIAEIQDDKEYKTYASALKSLVVKLEEIAKDEYEMTMSTPDAKESEWMINIIGRKKVCRKYKHLLQQ